MWDIILVLGIVFMFPPINAIMEKVQLHRYEQMVLKLLGKGIVLSITVLLCTLVITQIRNTKDTITAALEDRGMVEFTAAAPRIKTIKEFNGKRAVTKTRYYVKYTAQLAGSKLIYNEQVFSTDEMEKLVKQKAIVKLRVFEGENGEIYYGKESDTVESYLADNIAWKNIYQKIIVISAAALILLEILLIPLGIKLSK